MVVLSICLGRLGSSNSSRLLLQVYVEASSLLESTRWLLKMKVVLSLRTALVKLKDAIEFCDGCSMNTST
jgi:hypothetical protein